MGSLFVSILQVISHTRFQLHRTLLSIIAAFVIVSGDILTISSMMAPTRLKLGFFMEILRKKSLPIFVSPLIKGCLSPLISRCPIVTSSDSSPTPSPNTWELVLSSICVAERCWQIIKIFYNERQTILK